MRDLNPLKVPIVTLIAPFKLETISGNHSEKLQLLQFCKQQFELDEEFFKYLISKFELLHIEARCIRLDGY
jgi:hypothetical protein